MDEPEGIEFCVKRSKLGILLSAGLGLAVAVLSYAHVQYVAKTVTHNINATLEEEREKKTEE